MSIQYSISDKKLDELKVSAHISCEGGIGPPIPIHHYPLLAWMPAHHVHGPSVFTEDQKVSVADIARAVPESPSFAALADRFGTTVEHVRQALDYAMECGLLS